jgi:hypothetical protein
MTELFIAFCEERNVDDVLRVFDTKDAAVAFCHKFVRKKGFDPNDEDEFKVISAVIPADMYEYLAQYPIERYVFVMKAKLNDDSL